LIVPRRVGRKLVRRLTALIEAGGCVADINPREQAERIAREVQRARTHAGRGR
jgi:hypothetical protein